METRQGSLLNMSEEECLEAAINAINQGHSVAEASRTYNIHYDKLKRYLSWCVFRGHAVLSRAYSRVKNGGPIHVAKGRKPTISKEYGALMLRKQQVDGINWKNLTVQSFPKFISEINEEEKQKALQDSSYQALMLDLSEVKDIQRLMLQWFPEKVLTNTRQAERRINAALDPSNCLSLAATWLAVITKGQYNNLHDGKGCIDPALIFNLDTTNIFAGDPHRVTVYMTKETKEELRSLNVTAAAWEPQSESYQRRALQLVVLTSADGKRVKTVVKMKDNVIEELYHRKVCCNLLILSL